MVACYNLTLQEANQSTTTFPTHGVGHITLYLKCSNQKTNAFAEVSVARSRGLTLASVIVGWTYFAAWSASFYPQMYTNFRRKSVVGLNFDFLALNLMGFTCYSIFNICLYFIPSFQSAYAQRYPFSSIPVELNDVVFAVHAVSVTLLTICQCFVYERGNQRIARWALAFMASAAGVALLLLILVLCSVFSKLDYVYFFSYVKLLITMIKYVPQAWFNYSRKSTLGWSIGNIILDLTGGSLSILQMILLSCNFDDWRSIFGNPTKFGLGLFSILFDLLFILQHYVFYRHSSADEVARIVSSSPFDYDS